MIRPILTKLLRKHAFGAFAPANTSYSPTTTHGLHKMNYDGYLKNIIVYRCVTLIARSLASVPLNVYVEQEKQDAHPLQILLQKINPYQSRATFCETIASYFLLTGNCYVEMIKDAAGKPVELHALRPDRIEIVSNSLGEAALYRLRVGGLERDIPAEGEHGALLHIKSFHPQNDWFGLSPLEAAALSIHQHNTITKHNISLMENGGRPTGAIIVKTGAYGLDDAQRERLKSEIEGIYKGSANAGKLVVLEGDFEWREMGLSPKDMDFIDGKNQSAREIAQAFGVPPMLVGVPGDATFANYREARYHLWEDTILPILDHFLAEMSIWFEGYYDGNVTIRPDLDSVPALGLKRDVYWQKIASAGFLSEDDKRKLLGFGVLNPDQ
ncbi:MAG: phage portal protein [Alphaproteobacteria bacterium]|nr:phage portal protein [Alphaproteobacteria bacterium]OJV46837.1 MAG: phage portal protein [Alphaproteobacteria bacterium 43-37]